MRNSAGPEKGGVPLQQRLYGMGTVRLLSLWRNGCQQSHNCDHCQVRLMQRNRAKHKSGHVRGASKRWIANVHTDSTHPQPGLFTKDANTIARALASRKVSPKGPSSGMRMLTYFINRAGKGLSRRRRAELERAKTLLSERLAHSSATKRRRGSARRKP